MRVSPKSDSVAGPQCRLEQRAESGQPSVPTGVSARYTSRPEARGSGPEAVFRFLGSGVDFFAFLSRPEAVEKLEDKRRRIDPGTSSARTKRPIEFTNGHLQLECIRGRWLVRNWKDKEKIQHSWIAPEENFLSALIRPPGHGPSYNGNEVVCLGTRADRLDRPAKHEAYNAIKTLQKISQEQTFTRPEWPHENTATMVLYLQKEKLEDPLLVETTLH